MMLNPAPLFGGVRQCVSKVELRIECKDLLRGDITSKSDPCAVVLMKDKHSDQWIEIDRTEKIMNDDSPKFTKAIELDYYFEEKQDIKIVLVDIDGEYSPEIDDDVKLGWMECTLAQIISESPFKKKLEFLGLESDSKIIIRSEEIKGSNDSVWMKFHAVKLDSKDFLSKSDPYLEVLRQLSDGKWQVLHRTEVIQDCLDPDWRPFCIPINVLCGGDRTKPIKIDIYDYDDDGSHDIIGGFETTLEDMLKAADGQVQYLCINEKKKAKKKSYKDSGKVYLTSCKVEREYSFLDYIYGGTQINMTVGIDFTGSNGDPREPTSLHYINPLFNNEYMQAIRAVGDILQDYDSDKLFPVLGFGAQLPNTNEVSHEFAVNFNSQNPFCAGVEGILAAYQNCISQVSLYGPTNVSPIIHHVIRFAEHASQEESTKGAGSYYILLLLTDGVLSDMKDAIHAVVKASALPMSIIIVGVGGADFDDMNKLDGDNGVLTDFYGNSCHRDVVQFVPFRQFKASAALARQVLAEVPKQMTGYFKMKNLAPNRLPSAQPI